LTFRREKSGYVIDTQGEEVRDVIDTKGEKVKDCASLGGFCVDQPIDSDCP
jgi:hypothetical protein